MRSRRVGSQAIPVIASERGGQATLHAPGQLVSYPIVPIPRRDLRTFVHDLEEVLVVLLAGIGIAAQRREGRPGLYVRSDKIASVGLRCQRWVASHGTSLNVDIDLCLFDLIVSCGEPGLRQTSMEAVTGRTYPMDLVKELYLERRRRCSGGRSRPRARSPIRGWKLSWGLRRRGLRADRRRDFSRPGDRPSGPAIGCADSDHTRVQAECPRQDSNLRHLAPEASALSPELRGREEGGRLTDNSRSATGDRDSRLVAARPAARPAERGAIIPVRAGDCPSRGRVRRECRNPEAATRRGTPPGPHRGARASDGASSCA